MVSQDGLKSCIESLIADYKPLNKKVTIAMPACWFYQFSRLEGAVLNPEDVRSGNSFIHAPWLRIDFSEWCKDITLTRTSDAPQPKDLRMTNLKAVWK